MAVANNVNFSQTHTNNASSGIGGFFGVLSAILSGLTLLYVGVALSLPIIALIIKILLGNLTAKIAGGKGYNKVGFFWYGFFFFPIAVGVAILAHPISRNNAVICKDDEDEMTQYEKMYEAGTLSYTQLCEKKEELERRKYYK